MFHSLNSLTVKYLNKFDPISRNENYNYYIRIIELRLMMGFSHKLFIGGDQHK